MTDLVEMTEKEIEDRVSEARVTMEGEGKSSKEPLDPAPLPLKTVTFTYTEAHAWNVSVHAVDPKTPFNERDWNLIERMLRSKRAMLRREGRLEYYRTLHSETKK